MSLFVDTEVLVAMSPTRRNLRRAFGLAALCAAVVTPVAAAQSPDEIAAKADLLREVNAARVAHGVAPLKLSRVLGVPAVRHSTYLARTGKLDHNGADGRPFYVRLYAAGYSRRKSVGENLGMIGGCSTDAAKIMVDMWLDSPAHRRNLLSKDFKVVGLAVIKDRDCGQTVYTTDFGG